MSEDSVSNVSQRARTPLTSVKSYLEAFDALYDPVAPDFNKVHSMKPTVGDAYGDRSLTLSRTYVTTSWIAAQRTTLAVPSCHGRRSEPLNTHFRN